MANPPNLRLRLSNRPENVVVVRQAIIGLAEAVELDPLVLSHVSTAVSEACNNVVLHAYGGERGPLEVDVAGPSPLRVSVRDYGGGLPDDAERPVGANEVGGIGLPMIQALSQHVRFGPGEQRENGGPCGTEVEMEFDTEQTTSHLEPPHDSPEPTPRGADVEEVLVSIAPTEIAGPILHRVLSALAARAQFSTERIFDTQLVADAVVAATDRSGVLGRVELSVHVGDRVLELNVGPLSRGEGDALLTNATVDGVGSILDRLADGPVVSPLEGMEMLKLRLGATRPAQ
ncbi:MAG TPA: ATP-binding protein [Solirubrobacteraceae bacterium]|nr:ATP-binding protein [Solirubrobacteraceae bacterium]